ncbi:MAG TPA: terpene cyclase/mutase family protein [Anaerolineae bacterium]|nr:terpene cyclase/mutase family protein [Anaerolineae bacterium]
MRDWKHRLKADPTAWLLEPECPPVRYGTLVGILDRPPDDPEVRAAQAAIPAYPPVAELLAAQGLAGYWGKPDYYLPRAGRGTFWVLSVLGDLGLTVEEDHIRRACDWVFTHQRESGAFCRRRRVPGLGMVWQDDTEPCTHARIVRFLIQFGYAKDPRVRKAVDWLLPTQRDDGMWFCRGAGGHGCLRATLDILRIAALDPHTADRDGIAQAAGAVRNLLMEPRMSRYRIGEAWGTWECLKYPYFGFSVISALDALARLGHTPEEPRIAAALEYLLSRQLPSGTWPLDESWSRPPIDFGEPGKPNKWLTLDAMRAVKLLHSRH